MKILLVGCNPIPLSRGYTLHSPLEMTQYFFVWWTLYMDRLKQHPKRQWSPKNRCCYWRLCHDNVDRRRNSPRTACTAATCPIIVYFNSTKIYILWHVPEQRPWMVYSPFHQTANMPLNAKAVGTSCRLEILSLVCQVLLVLWATNGRSSCSCVLGRDDGTTTQRNNEFASFRIPDNNQLVNTYGSFLGNGGSAFNVLASNALTVTVPRDQKPGEN